MEGLCLDEIDIGGLVNALQGSKMSLARSPISPDEAPAWRPRTQQLSKTIPGVDTQLPAMVGTKLQKGSAIRSLLQSPVAVRKKAVRPCPQPFLLVEVENRPTVEAMHAAAKVIQIAYREIAIRRMLRAEAHAEAAAAQGRSMRPQMTPAVPPTSASAPAATTRSASSPPQLHEGAAPPATSTKPRPARRRLKARRRKKVQQQKAVVAGVLPPPAPPVQKQIEHAPQPAALAAPMPPALPPPAPKARKRRRAPEAACDTTVELPSAGVAEALPEANSAEALPEHIRLLIEDSESKGDRYQDELLTLRWQPRYQPVSEEEGGQESKHAEARPASAMGCEASTSKHKKRSRRVRSWKAIKKAVRKVRGKSKKSKSKSKKKKEKKIKNRATSPPPELRRRNSAPATAMFSPDRRKTRMSVADRNVELGMACLQLLGDNGVSPVSACRATEMFFTSTRELKVNLEPGTSFKSVMAELEALQQEAQQEQ